MADINNRENKRHSKESVVKQLLSNTGKEIKPSKKPAYVQRAYYITEAQAEALEWYRFTNKMDLSEIVRNAITAYIGEDKVKEFEKKEEYL